MAQYDKNTKDLQWVTINGVHVLISPQYKSSTQSKNESIAKKNEEIKNRQIARNQAEVDSRKPLPKILYLPDIPAEDANKSSDVLNLNTKQRYRFKDGTYIKNVYVFAGKGCSKEFRDADKYAKRWGGRAEDWQHCAGIAQITNGVKTLTREVHWVQGKDKKVREAFIKFHKQ